VSNTLRYHDGQGYVEANESDPFPVKLPLAVVNGNHKQVSVGTTATKIADANPRRIGIMITNVTGTQVVYLGFTGYVSASNGDYLPANPGSNVAMAVQNEIWGIAATSAQTVSVLEQEYA
jgi:hypothetical protein